MENFEVMLRAATAADEPFLFDLRRATMDEHLERAGESTDGKQWDGRPHL